MRSPRRCRAGTARHSGGIPRCAHGDALFATLRTAVVRSAIDASGNNSVVECDLAKVEVAGSNPVSRSTFFLPAPDPRVA